MEPTRRLEVVVLEVAHIFHHREHGGARGVLVHDGDLARLGQFVLPCTQVRKANSIKHIGSAVLQTVLLGPSLDEAPVCHHGRTLVVATIAAEEVGVAAGR